MNITELLLKYRRPLFEAEGLGGGAGGEAGAGASDAGAGDAGDGGGDSAAGDGEQKTALGGDAADDSDDKGDGDKSSEGDDGAAEPFKVEAPEGLEDFQGEFESYSSEASEWMAANPDASASDALKWAADRQAKLVGEQTKVASEAFSKQIETWENEAKADKEIGGDAYGANVATAMLAIKEFGGDDLPSVLNQSGLGSHPAMIKFAFNAGKLLADSPVVKTNEGTAKKSMAEHLYPSDK